jgi:hypothetical protein
LLACGDRYPISICKSNFEVRSRSSRTQAILEAVLISNLE